MKLSFKSQAKLRLFLVTLADGEKQIDLYRETLSEQRAFEPWALYKRITSGELLEAGNLHAFLFENGHQESTLYECA